MTGKPVVQDDIEEGTLNLRSAAVGNEAQRLELIQEETES